MSKYFTPNIEDIHVGYECEEIISDFSTFIDIFLSEDSTPQQYREAWGRLKCTDRYKSKPYTLTLKDVVDFTEYNGIAPEFKGRPIEMYIRTPYLTREQIEAEGWVETNSHDIFEKNGKLMGFLRPVDDFPFLDFHGYPTFKGECKDINTFRYICKLLKIN